MQVPRVLKTITVDKVCERVRCLVKLFPSCLSRPLSLSSAEERRSPNSLAWPDLWVFPEPAEENDAGIFLPTSMEKWCCDWHPHTGRDTGPPRRSVITVIMGIRYCLACLRACAFAHNKIDNPNHLGVETVRNNSQCKLAKSFSLKWQGLTVWCTTMKLSSIKTRTFIIMNDMASEWRNSKISIYWLSFYKVA